MFYIDLLAGSGSGSLFNSNLGGILGVDPECPVICNRSSSITALTSLLHMPQHID